MLRIFAVSLHSRFIGRSVVVKNAVIVPVVVRIDTAFAVQIVLLNRHGAGTDAAGLYSLADTIGNLFQKNVIGISARKVTKVWSTAFPKAKQSAARLRKLVPGQPGD